MVTEPQSSDLQVPLHGHTFLSLFPRTFGASKDAPNPSNSDDHESIHKYMKSMALRSPNELFEKAKAIVDGDSKLLNSKFASFTASKKINEAVDAKGKENPQDRRPALGHKRPRYPLKPITSQPSVSLEPSLEIVQVQDPEEFFLAYDKLENAKKINEAVATKGKENPQDRRPALGLKRARFSLKPITSQPSVSLEPSLEIDKLQDPEEFFLAYEKLENAKKELQRLRGGNTIDSNEYNSSTNTRHRRPGLLGKSVSYKHLYPSEVSENGDTFISSQETLHQNILSPSNYDLQQGTTNPNVLSQEKELEGSIAKPKNKVNEILNELLSSNSENLDGELALSLLQERLQIKPIDLDKLCLPDFHDIGRPDFVVLGEKFSKTHKPLSNIDNLVKVSSVKTPVKHKQVVESPVHPLASPTPPKSPFAAISLLNKRILQSNSSSDTFSALNIDLSPARNPFSAELLDRKSDQVDTRKESSFSGKLKSPVENEDSINLSDMFLNDKPSKFGVGVSVGSSRSNRDLEDHDRSNNMHDSVSRPNADTDIGTCGHNRLVENAEDMLQETVSSVQPDINIEGSTRHYNDTDVQPHGLRAIEENETATSAQPDINIDDRFMDNSAEDMLPETVSSVQPDINIEGSTRNYTVTDVQPHGLSEIEENVENMPQEAASSAQPAINTENSKMENLGQTNPTAAEDFAADVPSEAPALSPQQKYEERPKISLNEGTKTRRPREGRERKALSHRQSLAEAGMYWELGIRKSNRIKRKPLKYWKGERFLYGRVHESLPTVIGVKYTCPAKGDGKPTFTVESFVSDDYKELVDLAALH